VTILLLPFIVWLQSWFQTMSVETLKLQVTASVHAELAVEDLPDIARYSRSIDSTTLGIWRLSLEYGYFIVCTGTFLSELPR